MICRQVVLLHRVPTVSGYGHVCPQVRCIEPEEKHFKHRPLKLFVKKTLPEIFEISCNELNICSAGSGTAKAFDVVTM